MKKSDFIASTLKARIAQGEYGLRPFPSERVIASEFGVSYMTARSAVLNLVASGDLEREGRITRLPDGRGKFHANFVFVVPNWNNPNYWVWYPIIDKVVRELGGSLRFIVYQDWSDPLIFETLRQNFDGMFLFLYPGTPKQVLDLMEKRAGQIATFYDDHTDRGIYCLNYFPANGVELLLAHLKGLGHESVDCFNTQPHSADEAARIHAWDSARESLVLGGQLLDMAVVAGNDARQAAYQQALWRLRRKGGFSSAVFCTSAMTAIGLNRAAYELGLRAGADLSFCTLGMFETCRYLTPSVTCLMTSGLHHHVEKVVQCMLMKDGKGQLRFEPQTAELYFGESTGPVIPRTRLTAPR